VPLFSRCSQTELKHVAAVATELSLGAGERLTSEGERGREFFVVLDGAAAVHRKGRRIGTLRAGDVVGEIALVADVPRTATVTTEEPTRVLVIVDRDFRRLLLESPSMTFKIMEALAERLAMDSGAKRRAIV
jgi:CRP-like cAMP-binding protein